MVVWISGRWVYVVLIVEFVVGGFLLGVWFECGCCFWVCGGLCALVLLCYYCAFGFGFRVAGVLVICCSLWVQFRWVCL